MDSTIIRIARTLLELYDYITIEELAERVGVSSSSIRHRMSEIRSLLGVYGIQITNIPRRGIKLEASATQRTDLFNYLHEYSYSTPESEEYRKNYILKTLFEYSDNYTTQLFAEELFVSKKVIAKDLRELETMLNRYHVKLVIKRNSGVSMEGNEFDIRQAIIMHNNSLWWEKIYIDKPQEVDSRISRKAWTYMNRMYGDQDLLNIQDYLLQIEKRLSIVWTDIAFSRLLEYVIVAVKRIQMKWVITELGKPDLLPIDEKYLEVSEWLLRKLIGSTVTDAEVQYLGARIYAVETIEPHTGRNDERYRKGIEKYLEYVGKAIAGTGYSKNTGLADRLCDLLITLRYKENYQIIDWNDLNREIKHNVSELYAVCFSHIYILEEECQLVFRQDDIARITLLINNYMQLNRQRAIFVTATDAATAAYQLGKLRSHFPKVEFSQAVHYRNFREEAHEEEIIISTVDLPWRTGGYLKITKHVNEEDLAYIEKELSYHETKNAEDWHELFGEEMMWELSVRDKGDAISQICDRLARLGYTSEGFEEAVLRREQITPTSVGNGIAIPHVFMEHVNKEFIAVAKLKHAVLWDANDSVNLIFMIALKEQVSKMSRFFAEFYSLVSDEASLKEIQSMEGIKTKFLRENDGSHLNKS